MPEFDLDAALAAESYAEYQVTVKSAPPYWGDRTTRRAAMEYADGLASRISDRFNGIAVRRCSTEGPGNQDVTQGPDQAVCDEIDDWKEQHMWPTIE